MSSQTKENYLKAIFFLSSENEKVTISALSERLKVSNPTSNSMVKSLSELGWVNYEKYKPIQLTEEGHLAAARIVRRHRLTEMYLVERMGFGWEEVHQIAEEIEHLKSQAFFDRMDKILGFPTHDPHGSPIPDKNGVIKRDGFVPLSDCKEGDSGVLKALGYSSREFLEFLNSRNLELGLQIKIQSVEPFDNSMTVDFGNGNQHVLSKVVCDRLLVQLDASK